MFWHLNPPRIQPCMEASPSSTESSEEWWCSFTSPAMRRQENFYTKYFLAQKAKMTLKSEQSRNLSFYKLTTISSIKYFIGFCRDEFKRVLRMTRDSLVGTYREPQTWTGYGTYTYWFQTKSPTCPANMGKDSCEVYTSLPLSANTYWIMHALYFALINLNMKFQFCDKVRPDLLPNLLDPMSWRTNRILWCEIGLHICMSGTSFVQ